MRPILRTHSYTSTQSLASHKVLRNTYALLGLSLLVSAVAALAAVSLQLPGPGLLLSLLGTYGLIFAINANATNSTGILFVFLFTAFMGYSLCPLLNLVLHTSSGSNILISALMGTSVSFIALSSYALTSDKDFSFMGGFLFLSTLGCLVACICNLLLGSPIINLLIACAMTTISAGMILYKTSEIVHGGERNYILATVSLYISLYNLFVSIVQILYAVRSRD